MPSAATHSGSERPRSRCLHNGDIISAGSSLMPLWKTALGCSNSTSASSSATAPGSSGGRSIKNLLKFGLFDLLGIASCWPSNTRFAGELLDPYLANSTSNVATSPKPFIANLPCSDTYKAGSEASTSAAGADASTREGGQCCSKRAAALTASPKRRNRGNLSPMMPETMGPQCKPMRKFTPRFIATCRALSAKVASLGRCASSGMPSSAPSPSASLNKPEAAT
mmetsp:Transcript_40594/g.116670  ORF Transcript_40594/g.116670 Transcript_40594/m.116670 type:complete len:224 (+) Transcript_40594:179-850(+)